MNVPKDLQPFVGKKELRYGYKQFLREVLLSTIKWQEIEERRNEGDYSDDVNAVFPMSADLKAKEEPSEDRTAAPSILLEELFDEFKAKKLESKKWNAGTVRNHQPKFNSFSQFIGNQPVNFITKPEVIKYTKLLDRLPPTRCIIPGA